MNSISNRANKVPLLRILFLITQSELGGAQRFLLELLPKLDKQKYQISLAAGAGSTSSQYPLLAALKKQGIETIVLSYLRREISLFRDAHALFKITGLVKRLQPDVLFLISTKAGFLGSLAARLAQARNSETAKCRIIYRIGGWSFNDPWPKWKRWFFLFLEKISARWKDVIIVNNQHDLNQARSLGIIPQQSFRIVHNGINLKELEFLDKDEARLRLSELLPAKTRSYFGPAFTFGTIANFYPSKGLTILIQAARLLKEVVKQPFAVVVIGDGPERKNIELGIKNNGLDKEIFLTGALENAHYYLKAFDIFVLPSVKEGFPWALLEAMAAKLPIVATDVGAVPEILKHEKSGLIVKPSQPQLLSAAIVRLMHNDRFCRELSIEAHQTMLSKFQLGKMVKEIGQIIAEFAPTPTGVK